VVHAKNYETVSTFVKVMQKKTLDSFFPDTVYIFAENALNKIRYFYGNEN